MSQDFNVRWRCSCYIKFVDQKGNSIRLSECHLDLIIWCGRIEPIIGDELELLYTLKSKGTVKREYQRKAHVRVIKRSTHFYLPEHDPASKDPIVFIGGDIIRLTCEAVDAGDVERIKQLLGFHRAARK